MKIQFNLNPFYIRVIPGDADAPTCAPSPGATLRLKVNTLTNILRHHLAGSYFPILPGHNPMSHEIRDEPLDR